MGSPYTSQSASGYNSSPPADDGTAVASNKILWSTIKTKLNDPVKTLADAINSAVSSAFGLTLSGASVVSESTSYQVLSSDQGKLIRTTAAITVTTPDATSVTSPFVFAVLNSHSANITLDGSGAQTVNGAANVTIPPGQGCIVFTDGSNWFVIGSVLTTAALTVASLTSTGAISGTTIDGTNITGTGAISGATVAGAMVAVQSDMETGTATNLLVPPGRQHFHPGHPKCWASVSVSGGVPTLDTNYNITSITDSGVGDLTVTIATDFSTANYSALATIAPTGASGVCTINTKAAGSVHVFSADNAGSGTDPVNYNFAALGDQA